jgi:hypothetical protein
MWSPLWTTSSLPRNARRNHWTEDALPWPNIEDVGPADLVLMPLTMPFAFADTQSRRVRHPVPPPR